MNKRTLVCGATVLAVGAEGSQADLKEKANYCLKCSMKGCPDKETYSTEIKKLEEK